ncbi:MAG: hypothetical protein J7518_16540 [Nocardioidaceae bacterium]|nr:hypothetical protein [Nocardioidaceae bacterium]
MTTLDPNLLTAMADLKTAGWKAVREQRYMDMLTLDRELKVVCESFRRLHFPDAREAFVAREIGQPLSVLIRDAEGEAQLVYDEGKPGDSGRYLAHPEAEADLCAIRKVKREAS